MRLMMPGPEHRALAAMAGKWTGRMKVWNSMTPQAPPLEATEDVEVRTALGGRFVIEEARSSMMGMPMQRIAIIGYDNLQKAYTLTFYSSMETATNTATGAFDTSGKVLTLRGEFTEPQGKAPFKNVTRIEGDDARVFESYRIFPDGREVKVIEERLTRAR